MTIGQCIKCMGALEDHPNRYCKKFTPITSRGSSP